MAYGTTGARWDNETIPYDIDANDFPDGSADREKIDQAIKEWNDNTVIRLIPHRDETDFILFKDTRRRCDSNVGRAGGPQPVTCDLEGGFTAPALMHEIGHAVGFHHEHQRPDRSSFVRVGSNSDTLNCAPVRGEKLLTDYDCDSIMHYVGGVSSVCGGITPRATGCSRIGLAQRLSGRDVWGASLLYNVEMRFMVVWEDDSNDDALFDVHGSGLSENGRPCCGPLPINRLVSRQQCSPAVGMDGNRNMVFVWADDRDRNGRFDIKMRGFGANGRQSFSQRTVNPIRTGNHLAPDVAVANDGRFVVVWQGDVDGNGFYQIKARGFDSSGTERFAERTINVHSRGQQTSPRVAIAPDGFFVVLWEDDPENDGVKNIRMRGFRADGTQRWSERLVHVRSSGQQRRPRVAMGPLGDFVVVWEDDTNKNRMYQILMRAFTADGNEKFAQRTVNVVSRGQQLEPDVAVDDVFRPVVVWADDRDRNHLFQVKMRGFESDGRQRFPEVTVNTDEDGQQRRPAIAMEANGRFLVAWENDDNNDRKADILVRGFSADGREFISTRHVSNIPGGHKGQPHVTARAMSVIDIGSPF